MNEMSLKEKIIHEALRQFSRKGYQATSTVDIIDAVGTSKGGLYNHFKNKEDLFFACLDQARKIWRIRNLQGLEEISRPIDKIIKILENYRDNYLTDSENFPGGCIFVNFAIEFSDQHPHLAKAVHEGFMNLKKMLNRLLNEEKAAGTMRSGVDCEAVVDMIFSGLMGVCVVYSADKSQSQLDRNIKALINYVNGIKQ
jgi:TetR/AcrR family transcriptional repressor of nem operon